MISVIGTILLVGGLMLIAYKAGKSVGEEGLAEHACALSVNGAKLGFVAGISEVADACRVADVAEIIAAESDLRFGEAEDALHALASALDRIDVSQVFADDLDLSEMIYARAAA